MIGAAGRETRGAFPFGQFRPVGVQCNGVRDNDG